MIKFPWKKSKKSSSDSIETDYQNKDSNPSFNQVDTSKETRLNDTSSESIESIKKTYAYSDLPSELQAIVDQIKVADLQIQLTKDTLSMIRPTRDNIYLDLRAKLKDVPIIIDS